MSSSGPIRAALADAAVDAMALAGAGLIGYGAWLIYPPAGYISGGVMLVIAAVAAARRRAAV